MGSVDILTCQQRKSQIPLSFLTPGMNDYYSGFGLRVLVCLQCFEGGDREETVHDHSTSVKEQQQQRHTPGVVCQ